MFRHALGFSFQPSQFFSLGIQKLSNFSFTDKKTRNVERNQTLLEKGWQDKAG